MAEYICEIEKEDMYFQQYGELKQKLVRCKDCEFRGDTDKCVVAFAALKINTPVFIADNHGEWFCADGKPKDGEQE